MAEKVVIDDAMVERGVKHCRENVMMSHAGRDVVRGFLERVLNPEPPKPVFPPEQLKAARKSLYREDPLASLSDQALIGMYFAMRAFEPTENVARTDIGSGPMVPRFPKWTRCPTKGSLPIEVYEDERKVFTEYCVHRRRREERPAPHSMEVFWTRFDGLLYRDTRKGFDPLNFKTRRKSDVRVDNGAMHCRENDAHARWHKRGEQLKIYNGGHSRGSEDMRRHHRKDDK